jgi:hypothetical protein
VSEGRIYSAGMSPLLLPLQMLLLMFAGWVNRHQLDVIEYLQEENRVLKERMSGRRLRLNVAMLTCIRRVSGQATSCTLAIHSGGFPDIADRNSAIRRSRKYQAPGAAPMHSKTSAATPGHVWASAAFAALWAFAISA